MSEVYGIAGRESGAYSNLTGPRALLPAHLTTSCGHVDTSHHRGSNPVSVCTCTKRRIRYSGSDCLHRNRDHRDFVVAKLRIRNSARGAPPPAQPSGILNRAPSKYRTPIAGRFSLVSSVRTDPVLLGSSKFIATAQPIAAPLRPLAAPHAARVPARPHPSLLAAAGADRADGYRPRPAGSPSL